LVIAAAFLASSDVSAQVLLRADFDDKAIDAPIGTGGAVVGEPTAVWRVTAIVRDSPLSSPSLEISDLDDFGSGWADFDFLADAEISSGFVSISADIWMTAIENYNLGVRESGSAACFFLDVEFRDDGVGRAWDRTGIVDIDPSYPTGRVIPIEIIFDMDAGTYDLYYDESLALEDRPHGEISSCGVGSVFFGTLDDADYDGTIYVDNIEVKAYLFVDGFEAGDLSEWSGAVGGAK
jgi:hypothetical protein